MRRRRLLVVLLTVLALAVALAAQEKVDLSVVHRIRTEALENSKVMDHIFYLTDVYGPRLTGSPGFNAAADWAVKQLQGWGCENVKLEKWGPYGRSWALTRYSGNLLEPQPAPIVGFPLPWTSGTNGTVTGEAVYASLPVANDADLQQAMDKLKGTLQGKIVLLDNPQQIVMQTTPPGRRYTDADLSALLAAPEPRPGGPRPGGGPPQGARERTARRNQFLKDEGAALVLTPGQRGSWGVIVATSAGSREIKDPVILPTVAIAAEQYDRIYRLLDRKIPVRMEFNIEARLIDDATDSVNVIGEIPGGRKKDEVVMLGAHLDSWIGGTGAADNAAGCAIMLEAMRVLKALNLKMDRTVRVALWSAEEQGLLGSRAYVTEHFADRTTMALKPEHAKLSGYFNVDNGSGKLRGVYLQGNDMIRPVFQAWLEPFQDMGATTLSIRNTTGTDHLSFDAVGLPGFQFIQDPLEYSTRTHHANEDVYERVQPGDLMQASAIVAWFAYNAATRPELLPRKPLPKPQPR
jgi:carboxypeptidase Q